MEKRSGEYVRHQRVNGGGAKKKNSGTDDDEDVDRSGVDRGGGSSFGIDFPQAIERIRVIEQVRRKTKHRRHQQLHARQDSVVTDLVTDVLPSILATGEDTATTLPTLTVSTPPLPELSDFNIIPSGLPETSVPSILPTDSSGYPDVPIGSTEQSVLSSTPPPSPAETSVGMIIPTITSSSTGSTSSISESSSTDSSSSSTIVSPPYTTVTSYWPPQTARHNGTTSSDTRIASTTTIDGRVIIFTQVPLSASIYNSTSTQTPSSFTNSSISSTWSVNSTTSTSTTESSSESSSSPSPSSSWESSVSLWPSATESGGGGAGGPGSGVTSTSTAPSGSPTSTDASSGGDSPVSPGLLGGVLGGVAGFAFVLLAILFLLRRHRRELAIQARDDAGYGGAIGAGTGGASGDGDGEQPMVQRSSMSPFAAAGGFFMRSRQSQTSSETPASGEPSFVKISGRKLPPVIGGPRPVEPPSARSPESPFYHDDDIGWVGGPGTPVSSTGAGPSRYSGASAATASSPTTSSGPTSTTTPTGPPPILPPMGTSIAGPGPSRIPEERESDPELATPQEPIPRSTPIIRQPSAPGSQTDVTLGALIRPPFHRGMSSGSAGSAGSSKDLQGAGEILPAPAIPAAFARQISSERAAGSSTDGVGRSLPSRDGSRTSRFTEDIV